MTIQRGTEGSVMVLVRLWYGTGTGLGMVPVLFWQAVLRSRSRPFLAPAPALGKIVLLKLTF
jgi:type IV secretory pathway TrbD component